MPFLLRVVGVRALGSAAAPVLVPAATRTFSSTLPGLSKSKPARGATRKSLRNQAIFAALSPKLASRAKAGASSKKTNSLEPKEGETLLTLEQACEQLQATEAKRRPQNAFELHIVTTVSSHQTNALRGRIAYPRDPRTKQEKLLFFAEEGSAASEVVKELLKEETSSSAEGAEPSIVVGGSELISQVLSNRTTNFTKVLCTDTLLSEVSKALARSLGPKGLMPNARRGTVVPADDRNSVVSAIREARGAMDWRSDKVGVVRGAVGRLHFPREDVRKNVTTLLDAIIQKVPSLGVQATSTTPQAQTAHYVPRQSRSPGELKRAASIIKQVHLSSTQGPGLKLDLRDILA